MPATGVARPTKSSTARTSEARRRNSAAVSPKSPSMLPTPTRLNPATSRRMSSPAPGQEFGKVENSLCILEQYGPGIDDSENPQKSEICVTRGPQLQRDDPAL